MRPRKTDRHLPACMYHRHGAYYLVKDGKWQRLSKDYAEALASYGRELSASTESVVGLIDRALIEYRKKVKPNTLAQYTTAGEAIKTAFQEFAPYQVAPKHIAQFLDAHADTPNMANRFRTVLKFAFSLAVRSGDIERSPVLEIARFAENRRKRYISHAEFAAIYETATEITKVVMMLCYLTAQRIGDVLKIRIADLTDEGIFVQQQKTGKKVLVEWSPELREVVTTARTMHRVRSLFLVAQPSGKRYSYRGMRDNYERARVLAKVDDTTLHDLRAKSLTDAKKQGRDPQLLAGHDDPRTTKIYLRDMTPDHVSGPSFGQIGQK